MATQTQFAEAPPREPEPGSAPGRPRRVQVAQVLAFVAVLAALVGALGPATPTRTTYSWPPPALPPGNPTRVWYTPLLLAHRVPESVSATLPCRPQRPLPHADRPVTLLATARFPDLKDGLAVTASGRRLTASIGTQVLDRISLPGGSCSLRLQVANGAWSLTGGGYSRGGRVDTMPTVNGLFSEVDLRSPNRPSVDIAVVPQSARPLPRQTIAWILASVCALGALLLVSLESRSGRRRVLRGGLLRRALRAAHPADAAVAGLLLIWWVLSPLNPDDGWVETTERMFKTSGGFSNYFDALATNLPLAYWLDWLQRWITVGATSLVLLRIPALVCLFATWVLCRWTLARVLGPRPASRGATPWALAAMFVVTSFSWDMTLRPEPAIALLIAGVLASATAFAERQRAAPLALALVLVALAVTAHPAGIVSLAPLLAVAPTVVRWARAHFARAATMVPAAIALAVTLATVGSDVGHRSTDATTFRTFGDATLSWRDELLRYEYLTYPFFGTPLRRVSVALMLLVVLAYVLRGRRAGDHLLGLPARALAIGLALLVLNPDKLSWHFGTLLAIAAVAAAAETSRLGGETAAAGRSRALPYVWLGGAVVVAAWAWPTRQFWDSLDLRTLHWTLGHESSVSLSNVAAAIPIVALLVALLVGYARAGRRGVVESPWRAARWSIPLVVIPALVFTTAVLGADAARTSSWTLTGQNLDALRGRAGCGLADTLVAPSLQSVSALPPVQSRAKAPPVAAWVPSAPVSGLPRFPLGPVSSGSAATPWFRIRTQRPLGVLAAGAVTGETKLALEFARLSGHRARVLATEPVTGGTFQRGLQDMASWLFLAPFDRPLGPPRANAVRVALRGSGMSGEAIAVTSPVTYGTESVARALDRSPLSTLTNPFVLPYFPCLREPVLGGGVVEAPTAILSFPSTRSESPTGRGQVFTSDVYAFTRLPLVDPAFPSRGPVELVLYEAEAIPGAMLVRPSVTSST